MSQRPPRDLDWVPDDSTGISVPSQTKQNAGWLVEKPARQFFNWMWNRLSRWTHYFSGQSQEWIVIDSSQANEKDYDTLADYIAGSPAINDKILIKETQVLTSQIIIPSGITIKILDGVIFTRSTSEAISVIKFGGGIIIEGVLRLDLSQTGITAKAIELDGGNTVGKINVLNSSTGILTTAYHVNANQTGNRISGYVQNTGGGTLTNIIIDNSTENSNLLKLIDNTSKQIFRSLGSNTFFNGFKFLFGSDANGDIYYRDAGILKRLPKANDGDILSLASGIPEWAGPKYSFAAQLGSELNIAGVGFPSVSALDSENIAFIYTDGANAHLRKYNFNGLTWSLVGNSLSIPTTGKARIAALDNDEVAYIDDSNDDLRVYKLVGVTWTQIGNDLNITGVSEPALTALNGTDVAFIDQVNNDLRTYRFDGADWAQVGNDLNISGVSEPALATMNTTDIAFYDSGNADLRVYRFDGADWVQVGNDLNLADTAALTALNATDIAFIDDASADLRVYRFDGSDWTLTAQGINISGTFFPAVTALNGIDIAFIDQSNDDLRLYRFGVSLGGPFRP